MFVALNLVLLDYLSVIKPLQLRKTNYQLESSEVTVSP